MRHLLPFVACAVVIVGCSNSHSEMAGIDASITFDLGMTQYDTGVIDTDASIANNTNIGASCMQTSDCVGSDVTCDTQWPNGLCTLDCSNNMNVCPDGTGCVQTGRTTAGKARSPGGPSADRNNRVGGVAIPRS